MSPPDTYGRIPIDLPPGSLGGSMESMMGGIKRNLDAVAKSINQGVKEFQSLDSSVSALSSKITSLQALATQAASRAHGFVKLTATGSVFTWNLADLNGYPYLRAVVIDPNNEGCALNLPALGATDRMCVTVKCLANSGSVTIDAGAKNIVSLAGPGAPTYTIPFALIADGVTLSTYAATLIWCGTEWQIIENSVLVS